MASAEPLRRLSLNYCGHGRASHCLLANVCGHHRASTWLQVTVSIQNRYNTYRFDGEKMVVLSTTSWLGGKNNFLGIAYLVTGSVSLLFGLTFFGVQWRHPRKLGDTSYLSWNSRMLVDN